MSNASSSGDRTRIKASDPTMSSNRLATWYVTEGLPSGATTGRPADRLRLMSETGGGGKVFIRIMANS